MSEANFSGKNLFGELRRRRVFRTAAVYIVGTWLVLQVADVVFPALDIPERSIRYLLIAAILGFPVALVFGWFFDLDANGIRRTAPAGPGELAAAQPLRRSDYVILSALVVVIAVIMYNAVGQLSDEPLDASRRASEGPPLIAVLPLTSANREGDSEFFAYGIHDDLLTQLAHLQSMRVISRTSVLEYKDTVMNIRDIGAALGADAILEGGVQQAGERIRINAQLIDAHTDEHLWAQTYDREMTAANIFEVQSEIARAIAHAMHATLTEQDSAQLNEIPTDNLAAYRAFREAMGMPETWSRKEYRELLEEAIRLDPTFTRAMAELVGYLSQVKFFGVDPGTIPYAEELLERVEAIAPNSPDSLYARAYFAYYALKDNDLAIATIDQALELSPSDTGLLEVKSWVQRRQGKLEEGIDTIRELRRLDPMEPMWTAQIVNRLTQLHRYDEAEAEIRGSEHATYLIAAWDAILQLRHHRDWQRWSDDLAAVFEEFKGEYPIGHQWEMLMDSGDYEAAEALLPQTRDDRLEGWVYLTPRQSMSLLTWWATGQEDKLSTMVRELHEYFKANREVDGSFSDSDPYLYLAHVTAVEGDPAETERLVRQWRRNAADDKTELLVGHHQACRTLGVAGAAVAAVECLRKALLEPSGALSFHEPYSFHYGRIREHPDFQEFLAEVEVGEYAGY